MSIKTNITPHNIEENNINRENHSDAAKLQKIFDGRT